MLPELHRRVVQYGDIEPVNHKVRWCFEKRHIVQAASLPHMASVRSAVGWHYRAQLYMAALEFVAGMPADVVAGAVAGIPVVAGDMSDAEAVVGIPVAAGAVVGDMPDAVDMKSSDVDVKVNAQTPPLHRFSYHSRCKMRRRYSAASHKLYNCPLLISSMM